MACSRHQLVVFLDVDGVLNTVTPANDSVYFHPRNLSLRLSLLSNFIELHKQFHFFVILSSAWRTGSKSCQVIKNILQKNNIDIINYTPIFPSLDANPAVTRRAEILDSVHSNNLKNYIVIDDLPLNLPKRNFVHTYFNHGLNNEKREEFKLKASLLF
jgi:hypothetical protein